MGARGTKAFVGCEKYLICPLCRLPLRLSESSLKCTGGHNFDIARQGYVNLLRNHQPSGPYNRESFLNRRQIFLSGLYEPLVDKVKSLIDYFEIKDVVVDAGCGEGFFTSRLACEAPSTTRFFSFDISKEAIPLAAAENHSDCITWFVSDLAAIPIQSQTTGCVINLFSPANYTEFSRLLRRGGIVIKAIPTQNHFIEIRDKVYESRTGYNGYSNKRVLDYFAKHCRLIGRHTVSSSIEMTPDLLSATIGMTPIMFGVDGHDVDWSSVTSLTMESDVLVGSFE